jgi:hypothetical protein
VVLLAELVELLLLAELLLLLAELLFVELDPAWPITDVVVAPRAPVDPAPDSALTVPWHPTLRTSAHSTNASGHTYRCLASLVTAPSGRSKTEGHQPSQAPQRPSRTWRHPSHVVLDDMFGGAVAGLFSGLAAATGGRGREEGSADARVDEGEDQNRGTHRPGMYSKRPKRFTQWGAMNSKPSRRSSHRPPIQVCSRPFQR